MKHTFDLAARENQTADVDATITSNKLNAEADKEIVLQGTIDSLICDEVQLVKTPVSFTVQNIEIASDVSTYIVRIYDNKRHVLLKQIQDKWPDKRHRGKSSTGVREASKRDVRGMARRPTQAPLLQRAAI